MQEELGSVLRHDIDKLGLMCVWAMNKDMLMDLE